MNIVVLDGFALNPGDLSWEELKGLGTCEIHARTAREEVVQRAFPAEVVLTNKSVVGREELEKLPNLRYIGVLATGTNIVDLEAARARNIPVTNVPAYGTRSVAQATMALLLELAHHVGEHADGVREGRWSRNPDWCYWERELVELHGLVLGIVGFGRIGQAVARLGAAFGMKLLVAKGGSTPLPASVKGVDLDGLFNQSDIISLHCPLTPATRNLVNAQRLSLMKPTAFLLNTSRGQLIDEAALADALNSGKIAGAGLDVLSVEPPPADHVLLRARHCILTPHQAWATRAARSRLMAIAIENIRAFIEGRPQNVVN